ncbi:MAG: ABC transporter permease subunit [Gemmataceae bacterium]|nr:ABC transporter permease subunit [Gemmataceae bacterium]
MLPRAKVTVGSKTFTESVILGDIVQLLAASDGDGTSHRRSLGGTKLVWEAMVNGTIDVYPEYTGTITKEILADDKLNADDEAGIRSALGKHGIRMSQPLGFNNPYALGMKKARAAQLGIEKISDLAKHPELKFGFTNEFMNRGDGWPSLRARYQLPQTDVRGVEHVLAYPALAAGSLDLTDLYATDAAIRKYDLKVLDDDRHVFPPYRAVLLYRADLESRAPDALAAVLKLQGLISNDDMVAMNARTDDDRVDEKRVAADYLTRKLGNQVNIQVEGPWQKLLWNTLNHLFLVSVSLLAAIVAAVPLGILAAQRPTLGQFILGAAGILQTVPSLALLVFMVVLLNGELGAKPAIIALFLYSLLPIVRNTYTGLRDIPLPMHESAEALGLSPSARLFLIELPMASRSILAGIKTSAVINVGNATLGGLIGAGGYGQPIFEGLRRWDPQTIFFQGVLPAALMALAVQGLFELAERRLVSRGLRLQRT